MATQFSSALRPYSGVGDTPASSLIKLWAQFVEDVLVTTGGWVVTTDTGQTVPSTLLGSAATNTKMGYRIYRMSDALQATAPVFMRIDYGTGAAASNPGFWITIGTGSNGAGVITGILWNGGVAISANVLSGNNSNTQLTNSYGSAAPSRAAIALFIQSANTQFPTIFTIERTKSALGADTGDGLLLTYTSAGSSPNFLNTSRYIINVVGGQPNPEIGLSYILTRQSPTQTFAPGDIGVGIVIHFKGIAQQPGTNVLITNSADVSAEGIVRVILYNQTMTFVQLGTLPPGKSAAGAATATNDASARVLMRYD